MGDAIEVLAESWYLRCVPSQAASTTGRCWPRGSVVCRQVKSCGTAAPAVRESPTSCQRLSLPPPSYGATSPWSRYSYGHSSRTVSRVPSGPSGHRDPS